MTVRELRLSAGWTQAALATHLRVSRPYLSQVESGAKPLPIARARSIVEALGVPEDDQDATIGRLLTSHRDMARGGA